jgi:hypothetical protein
MKGLAEKIIKFATGKDLLAKLICLALAVILWTLVTSSKVETLKFKIPITLKNLAPNLIVSNTSNRFATVQFEGRNDDLKNPMLKTVKAFVNLENASAGQPKYYPVEIEKQEIPEEITVSALTKEILVTVDLRENKWVEVVPAVTGRVPESKIIIDKTVTPDRVKVNGPRSELDTIQSVETDDVSVDNETSEFERQVGLKKDDRFKNVTFGTTLFTVRVVIVDAKNISALGCQLRIRNASKDYTYEMKSTQVVVYVRTKDNRAVTPADVEVFIDAGELDLGTTFEDEKVSSVWRELPIIVIGKIGAAADIISYMPKKVWIKISRNT